MYNLFCFDFENKVNIIENFVTCINLTYDEDTTNQTRFITWSWIIGFIFENKNI